MKRTITIGLLACSFLATGWVLTWNRTIQQVVRVERIEGVTYLAVAENDTVVVVPLNDKQAEAIGKQLLATTQPASRPEE